MLRRGAYVEYFRLLKMSADVFAFFVVLVCAENTAPFSKVTAKSARTHSELYTIMRRRRWRRPRDIPRVQCAAHVGARRPSLWAIRSDTFVRMSAAENCAGNGWV